MQDKSRSGAEVRFLDYDQILRELRQAVSEAKAAHPEIIKVLLFGSLAQGNWPADSDADLIVVVGREFPHFFGSRAPYQVLPARFPPTRSSILKPSFRSCRATPKAFSPKICPPRSSFSEILLQ